MPDELTPQVVSHLTEADPEAFGLALAAETEKRASLEAYIKNHLKDGTDYGTITFGNGKQSKATLFKPGAEKVTSLLHLRASFRADEDTLRMVGEVGTGIVAYICSLMTPTGEVVAEGRGAAGTEKTDINTRIKIAEKRAMVDAVLRVAALSDHFSQDLEDMEATKSHRPNPIPRAPTPAAPAARAPSGETSSHPITTGEVWKFGKHKGQDIGHTPTKYLVMAVSEDGWMDGKPGPYGKANCTTGQYAKSNAKIRSLIIDILRQRKGATPAPAAAPEPAPEEGPPPEYRENEGAGADFPVDDIPFSFLAALLLPLTGFFA